MTFSYAWESLFGRNEGLTFSHGRHLTTASKSRVVGRRYSGITQEILTLKQSLIDFDRVRADLNQGFRSARKTDKDNVNVFSHGIFIKLPKASVEAELRKVEQEIERTRDELKAKVLLLNEMTGKVNEGFDLKAVTAKELQSFTYSV
jgi:hypothetical protein